jgi:hypothetical protein
VQPGPSSPVSRSPVRGILTQTVARPPQGGHVSLEDLRGWGGRELLLAVLALALVLALVVVALVDWLSA